MSIRLNQIRGIIGEQKREGYRINSLNALDMEWLIERTKKAEELDLIARKQNDVIENLHKFIFGNENIKEEEREFILANLDTVIRLY
ncbi:hypothetical protein [Bacillus sp. 1P06AnD]|uniref:hypothetical protein n=1 Tax=Bacillus sp. 1P06AnD TaxID=3132208 RepID=UPI0039A2BB02